MASDLFKKHSMEAIERVISEALTGLLGRETTAKISGLTLIDAENCVLSKATFEVTASHESDWSSGINEDGSFK
ncbi:MAG: hypothetical protein KBC94_23150 [Pseudacidovorax sp.]|uniref:hypothetical protein n=1 Tax=Pseudacidovorax sp. TaxID=1934311 RepID=UPI001B6E7854|nr:hypothetical protein [Pseudacidovorax sp.]MBP6897324.1 hypothetical protein [Pseudacidovorax sp.]